jgi:hypothetical protein
MHARIFLKYSQLWTPVAAAGLFSTIFFVRAACFDGHFEIVKYLVEHNAGKYFLQ